MTAAQPKRPWWGVWWALGAWTYLWLSVPVWAHGARVGAIDVDHPYALATPAPSPTAVVYFRAWRNRGSAPDRLLRASSPIAARVVLEAASNGQPSGPWREVAAIPLGAHGELRMGHAQAVGQRLRLDGVGQPLLAGDRFPLELHFEKAGHTTVQVRVEGARLGTPHTH